MASKKKKFGIGGAVAGAVGYGLLGKRGRGLIGRFAKSGRRGSGFASRFLKSSRVKKVSKVARSPWSWLTKRRKFGKAGAAVAAAKSRSARPLQGPRITRQGVLSTALRKRGGLSVPKVRRNRKRKLLPGTTLPSMRRR